MGLVHFRLTLEEHRAARGSYVDPSRYVEGGRDYQPEMICHTGDGHAKGVRSWSEVTCPACLAKGRDVIVSRDGASLESGPGEVLTMGDGSRWFHSYSGGAPVRLDREPSAFFEPLREAARTRTPLSEIGGASVKTGSFQ